MHCRMHACAPHVSNDALRGQSAKGSPGTGVTGGWSHHVSAGDQTNIFCQCFLPLSQLSYYTHFGDRFLLYNSSWCGTHYVTILTVNSEVCCLCSLPTEMECMHHHTWPLSFSFRCILPASVLRERVCVPHAQESQKRTPDSLNWSYRSSARAARPLTYQANFLAPNVLSFVIFLFWFSKMDRDFL